MGTPHELREKTMDRAVLVLEGQDILEWMGGLETLESCAEVAVFGNTLHITADDAETATREIRTFMAASSITDFRLEQTEPSLEDVFVGLIRRGEQEG